MGKLTLFLIFSFAYFGLFSQRLSIVDIQLEGNQKTKDFVIFRELDLKVGLALDILELEERIIRSKQNLQNTSLFNDIQITHTVNNQNVSILVQLKERWYLWPSIIFQLQERNFNDWWVNGHQFNRVNYGFSVRQFNFRGQRENLTLLFQSGYTDAIGIKYEKPMIKPMSPWGFVVDLNYATRHEIPVNSDDNKWVFYKNDDVFLRTETKGYFEYYLRQGFYTKHRFLLDFKKVTIDQSVLDWNQEYLMGSNQVENKLLSFIYHFRIDRRNNQNYPTKGSYFEAEAVKKGLGVFNNLPNYFYFQSEWKLFRALNERLFTSTSLRGKLSNQNIPGYYYQSTMSSRDLPRGYDLYAVDAQNFFTFKSNLKYNWFKKRKFNIKPIPFSKFNEIHFRSYFGPFFDIGYLEDMDTQRHNPLNYNWLISGGLGLDVVTYYDLVLRVEYTYNHLLEKGLFIHFTAPI